MGVRGVGGVDGVIRGVGGASTGGFGTDIGGGDGGVGPGSGVRSKDPPHTTHAVAPATFTVLQDAQVAVGVSAMRVCCTFLLAGRRSREDGAARSRR